MSLTGGWRVEMNEEKGNSKASMAAAHIIRAYTLHRGAT